MKSVPLLLLLLFEGTMIPVYTQTQNGTEIARAKSADGVKTVIPAATAFFAYVNYIFSFPDILFDKLEQSQAADISLEIYTAAGRVRNLKKQLIRRIQLNEINCGALTAATVPLQQNVHHLADTFERFETEIHQVTQMQDMEFTNSLNDLMNSKSEELAWIGEHCDFSTPHGQGDAISHLNKGLACVEQIQSAASCLGDAIAKRERKPCFDSEAAKTLCLDQSAK